MAQHVTLLEKHLVEAGFRQLRAEYAFALRPHFTSTVGKHLRIKGCHDSCHF